MRFTYCGSGMKAIITTVYEVWSPNVSIQSVRTKCLPVALPVGHRLSRLMTETRRIRTHLDASTSQYALSYEDIET